MPDIGSAISRTLTNIAVWRDFDPQDAASPLLCHMDRAADIHAVLSVFWHNKPVDDTIPRLLQNMCQDLAQRLPSKWLTRKPMLQPWQFILGGQLPER